jgi:hypothetical protein
MHPCQVLALIYNLDLQAFVLVLAICLSVGAPKPSSVFSVRPHLDCAIVQVGTASGKMKYTLGPCKAMQEYRTSHRSFKPHHIRAAWAL